MRSKTEFKLDKLPYVKQLVENLSKRFDWNFIEKSSETEELILNVTIPDSELNWFTYLLYDKYGFEQKSIKHKLGLITIDAYLITITHKTPERLEVLLTMENT